MAIKRLVLLAGSLACVCTTTAMAQSADAKLRDQLRQTILELRRVDEENASLKAQLATLTTAQDAAKQLERSLAEEKKKSRRADELQQTQLQLMQNLQQLQAQNAQQAATLNQYQIQYNALGALQRDTQGRVDNCTARNAQLVRLSDELVRRYRDRGFFDVLLSREPLTGLKRVELEKLAQDYRGKVLDQQLAPARPEEPTQSR